MLHQQHCMCCVWNIIIFFRWSWHQLHNYNAKITDVTSNGGVEQLGWDYLFLLSLYFTNWVRLNKPNKFLKSANSFSERHFNHCHYDGCSLLLYIVPWYYTPELGKHSVLKNISHNPPWFQISSRKSAV